MFVISKVRLAKDTRPLQTKSGIAMRSTFGFADVDDEHGMPLSIVAFGNLADELGKYHKGDTLRLSGTFKANNWTDKEGKEVKGFQLVADGIAGVKSARGKYSTPKPKADQQQRNQAGNDFYEDSLTF